MRPFPGQDNENENEDEQEEQVVTEQESDEQEYAEKDQNVEVASSLSPYEHGPGWEREIRAISELANTLIENRGDVASVSLHTRTELERLLDHHISEEEFIYVISYVRAHYSNAVYPLLRILAQAALDEYHTA